MKVLDYFKSKRPKAAEQKGAADTVSLSDRKAMAMAAAASEKPVQVSESLKADVKNEFASLQAALDQGVREPGNAPVAPKPATSGDDNVHTALRQNQNNQSVVQSAGSPTDDRAGITATDAKARGISPPPKVKQGEKVSGPSAPMPTPQRPSVGGRKGRGL